jgi:hypothetical protein
MMIHLHIKDHLFYYITMVLLQILGFLLVYFAAPNVSLQMDFVVINSGIYTLWASLHHYLHHDLHPKIVIEYVLVGFLGIGMTFFMFQLGK